MYQGGRVAAWHDGFNPSVITDGVDKTKTVGADGRASFHGFAHTEHLSILTSMLRLNREIPDLERRKIVNLSMFAAAASGKVTPDALIAEVSIREKQYLATPKRRFRLVSSISMSTTTRPLMLRLQRSQLCFGWKPNRSTAAIRSKLVDAAKRTIAGDLPTHYSAVSALVTARTKHEAVALALDGIDLIRGIWNLWKNRASWIRISSGARTPVNAFILGPIHTLHTPDGKPVADDWWYEPSYRGPISVWSDETRIIKMLEFARRVRGSLLRLPYRDTVVSALIRYARALDSREWNDSFLQLWSVIELLTGTTENESHKTTVKRAAFIYKNRDYATQALLHLRYCRNAAVHSGEGRENVEPLMYQAKNTVEALIEFHLWHAGQFARLADAAVFLESPSSVRDIDNQIRRLEGARKYLSR